MTDELAEAAGTGDLQRLKSLLADGADPNGPASSGVPPIFAAAAYGHPAAIEVLVAAGADVNARSQAGATPLMAACYVWNPQTAQCLIKLGANVTARDDNGRTALLIACQHSSREVVEALLENGASANDAGGGTNSPALAFAIYNDSDGERIIKLLLERGADRRVVDESGRAPVDHARSRQPSLVHHLQ